MILQWMYSEKKTGCWLYSLHVFVDGRLKIARVHTVWLWLKLTIQKRFYGVTWCVTAAFGLQTQITSFSWNFSSNYYAQACIQLLHFFIILEIQMKIKSVPIMLIVECLGKNHLYCSTFSVNEKINKIKYIHWVLLLKFIWQCIRTIEHVFVLVCVYVMNVR